MSDEAPELEDLDACDVDFAELEQSADEDLDGIILFADVDPADVDAIERRAAEWRSLFGVEAP